MMRPSTKEKKGKDEKISARYAPMFVPNLTWDFYDAFTSSEPTRIAHSRQTVSTTDNNLEKYLLAARNRELQRNRAIANEGVIQLPRYLKIMQQVQSDNGKFEDLTILLKLLELPKHSMDAFSMTNEWEKATYLAIAVYRLNPDYFEQLRESFDRAVQWAPLPQPVFEARSILLSQAGDGYEPLPPPVTTSDDSNGDESRPRRRESLADLEKLVSSRPKTPATPSNHGMDEANPESSLSLTNPLTDPSGAVIGGGESPPRSPLLDSFAHVKAALASKLAIDETKVAQQRQRVEEVEQRVIRIHDRIEVLVREIMNCVKRCVDAYNACELFVDRYRKFDELTARLSEGFRGSPAYEDWRRDGVPGYREVVIDFFVAVQEMAEERLTLQELLQPKGRDWTQQPNPKHARKRWSIIFNGENLVLKVIHYLDFLRKCRELSDWYGNGFYFAANPLMVAFPIARAKELFKMEPLLHDQLYSLPYDRRGIVRVEDKRDWKHQQFLNDFRRRFFDASKDRVFNWPTLPNIREEAITERVFTCFLVMFICAEPSIVRTNDWEKEFIGQISSMRGAAKLLVGKPNRKEDKPLYIPPVNERKPRAPVFATGLKPPVAKGMIPGSTRGRTSSDDRSKGSGSYTSGDELDEAFFEQYFQQNPMPTGTSPTAMATVHEHGPNDDSDDDDSYDENGELKPKPARFPPDAATAAATITAPTATISRLPARERRQSHVAKAQQFQSLLHDDERRKQLKKHLQETPTAATLAATASANKATLPTGAQQLRQLAAQGARHSVLVNRGVPMMSMNMLAMAQGSGVLTAETSTTATTAPDGSIVTATNPTTATKATTNTIGGNTSPLRRNQRAMSRIQLAPPGLASPLARKASITAASSPAGQQGSPARRASSLLAHRKTSGSAPSASSALPSSLAQISEVSQGDDDTTSQGPGADVGRPTAILSTTAPLPTRVRHPPVTASPLLATGPRRSSPLRPRASIFASNTSPDTEATPSAVAAATSLTEPSLTDSLSRPSSRRAASAGTGMLRRPSSTAALRRSSRSELALESMKSRKVSRILPPMAHSASASASAGAAALTREASLTDSSHETPPAASAIASSSQLPPSLVPPQQLIKLTKRRASQTPTKRMSVRAT